MINAEHAEPAEARLRRPGLHGRPAAPSDRPQTRIIKPQYAFVFRADTDGASLRESRRSRASLCDLCDLSVVRRRDTSLNTRKHEENQVLFRVFVSSWLHLIRGETL